MQADTRQFLLLIRCVFLFSNVRPLHTRTRTHGHTYGHTHGHTHRHTQVTILFASIFGIRYWYWYLMFGVRVTPQARALSPFFHIIYTCMIEIHVNHRDTLKQYIRSNLAIQAQRQHTVIRNITFFICIANLQVYKFQSSAWCPAFCLSSYSLYFILVFTILYCKKSHNGA